MTFGSTRDLRVAITPGEIPQGQVFNEADLIARCNVSTSPLREALTRLRQDGLVKVIPRRGYAVAELTLRDFHELVRMRMINEGGRGGARRSQGHRSCSQQSPVGLRSPRLSTEAIALPGSAKRPAGECRRG